MPDVANATIDSARPEVCAKMYGGRGRAKGGVGELCRKLVLCLVDMCFTWSKNVPRNVKNVPIKSKKACPLNLRGCAH